MWPARAMRRARERGRPEQDKRSPARPRSANWSYSFRVCQHQTLGVFASVHEQSTGCLPHAVRAVGEKHHQWTQADAALVRRRLPMQSSDRYFARTAGHPHGTAAGASMTVKTSRCGCRTRTSRASATMAPDVCAAPTTLYVRCILVRRGDACCQGYRLPQAGGFIVLVGGQNRVSAPSSDAASTHIE